MGSEFTLTVREALKRPMFQEARVAAGAGGLDRQIRWVHILEVPGLEKLLDGNEMILTTGVGFHLNEDSFAAYVLKLIHHQAACLCIEKGPYFNNVSDRLRQLADEHSFPLILFPGSVRFVDITQDLHSLIISRHHRTLQELESISRQFHRLSLTAQGTLDVLKLLYKSTHRQLLYRPLGGHPVFFPAVPKEQEAVLLQELDAFFNNLQEAAPDGAPASTLIREQTAVLKPIGALHQTWAYLVMLGDREPAEYDGLLLDSASLSIAQELLRTRYMEERKLFSENLWVDELLNSQLQDEKQLHALAAPYLNRIADLHLRVCLVEITSLPETARGRHGHSRSRTEPEMKAGFREEDLQDHVEWESIRYHLSLTLRSILEKYGYRSFMTFKNNRLAVIAVEMKGRDCHKERLTQALEALGGALDGMTSSSRQMEPKLRLAVGAGRSYTHLREAGSSYQEAVKALSLQACMGKSVVFYEELGVFALLLNANDGQTLQQFVRSYLGPVLDYDRTRGGGLLVTLKVYLDHDGSKQIAAQKLFIVRQSLYYRLEKIKELLGESFMEPEKRIAIQVALRAYQLLHPGAFSRATPEASRTIRGLPGGEASHHA